MAGGVLVAVQSVQVCSDDGESNATTEAWRAFTSAGIVEAEPTVFAEMHLLRAPGGGGLPELPRAEDLDLPGQALSPEHVLAMLANTEPWMLLVRVDDKKYEVLERAALKGALTTLASLAHGGNGRGEARADGPVKLPLRQMTADEARVVTATTEKGLFKRIEDANAWPPTVLTVLTAIGGVAALSTDVSNPPLMVAALVLGVAAIVVSALKSSSLKPTVVHWTRLDEVMARTNRQVGREAGRIKIPVALAVLAAILTVLAYTTGDGADTSGSIKLASTDRTGEARTANLEVEWKDLDDSVKQVRTTATGGAQPVEKSTAADGSAKQEIKVPLPGPGSVEVTTRAYDDAGKPVGTGYIKTVTVK